MKAPEVAPERCVRGSLVSAHPPRFALSIPEAAEALRVSERTIRSLLADDPSLPRVHLGRRVVIPSRALDDWINRKAQEEREQVRRAVRALRGARH